MNTSGFFKDTTEHLNNTITWKFGPAGRLTIGILQLILNASMLTVILFKKHLLTSFTIYILFLCSANLIYTICEYPLEIVRQLYSHWPLSSAFCDFYLYQIWIVCPITMHMHVLITLNRIWAIAFPISYRNHHNKWTACVLCAGIVLYLHVLVLPLWIRDVVYYRADIKGSGCSLNTEAQKLYSTVVAIVTQELPIVFVVGAYPFLWCKQLNRKKGSVKVVEVVNHKPRKGVAPAEPAPSGNQLVIVMAHSVRQKAGARPFLVLTLLTTSVLICWTPDQTYWTVTCFATLSDNTSLRNCMMVLYGLQAVLDPILFAFSMSSFRMAVTRWFISCRKRKATVSAITKTYADEYSM